MGASSTHPSTGSSPRVRGKRRIHVREPQGVRLIPACAGKTGGDLPHPVKRGAHPRVCGENRFDTDPLLHDDGSSPRVRGKPGRPRSCPPLCGLIPACAGKTRLMGFQGLRRRAHPRVCGENLLERRGQLPRQGSSPRVRGKPCDAAPARRDLGLIPACAGKTLSPDTPDSMVAAHPRVCGENRYVSPRPSRANGSSPRVRGKLPTRPVVRPRRGLIPACAGKTRRRRMAARPLAAHPRVCGENIFCTLIGK